MDTAAAMDLYRRTTARDALHMDAWLRLADLTAAAGDLGGAARITAFCDGYIAPVLRWKWPHTLLAHGLGMDAIFGANINYLVARRTKLNDAFNLLDTHCQASPAAALAILQPDNQPAYLEWAIRWKRCRCRCGGLAGTDGQPARGRRHACRLRAFFGLAKGHSHGRGRMASAYRHRRHDQRRLRVRDHPQGL